MTCSDGWPHSRLGVLKDTKIVTETHGISAEKYPIFAIGGRIFSYMHLSGDSGRISSFARIEPNTKPKIEIIADSRKQADR